MSRRNQATSPLQSVLAGGVAGGAESFITYPTEYIKTRKQLMRSSASPVRILIDAVRASGPGVLYTGAGAFCISNASKSGVRFLTFDTVRDQLPRDQRTGKPAGLSTMAAGAAAGLAESVTVVTPGENIKTKIVDDRAGPRQFRSTGHAVRYIAQSDGLSGFFRGVVPVSMKQSSNAIVRFTSYSMLLDVVTPTMNAMGLTKFSAATAGAGAGIITVYATMPFDVIKTRMQSLQHASSQGTLQSLREIMQHSGVRGLWEGTTPRLVRLSISGALSFSIYEQMIQMMQSSSRAATLAAV